MAQQKEIKIKAIGKYNGHSFKPNGAVEISFKFSFEELGNYYMKLPLLRSENTKVIVRIEDEDPIVLGTFMLRAFSMDHDGEGQIKFNSQYDSVEANNINELVPHKDKLIKVLMKASIEVEENDEEEEEED